MHSSTLALWQLLLAAPILTAAAAADAAAAAAASAAAATAHVPQPSAEQPQLLPHRRLARDDSDAAPHFGNGFVRFPIHASERRRPLGTTDDVDLAIIALAKQLSRRQSSSSSSPSVETDLTNIEDGLIYSVEIGIGTPAQKVEVVVDTGSSELWVNPNCTTISNALSRNMCRDVGRYDPTRSETAVDLRRTGSVRYGSGDVRFQYIADTVTIGSGTQVKNQTFGAATRSTDIFMGIMGLGPRLGRRGESNYSLFLESLASQGHIGSRAFSLDLRSVDSPKGAIIFGGIDTTKFVGDLAAVPMLNARDTPLGADRYYIRLTSMAVTPPPGSSSSRVVVYDSSNSTVTVGGNNINNKNDADDSRKGLPVFLDSGATVSHLPRPIVSAMAAAFPNARFVTRAGFYQVECDAVAKANGTVDFTFEGGKVVRVGWSDFIWRPSEGLCVLGVSPLPASQEEPILGASFLRAAYVVYDQENRKLHLAQAADCDGGGGGGGGGNNGGDAVVSIGKGSDAVPSGLKGKCTVASSGGGNGGTSGNDDESGAGAARGGFWGPMAVCWLTVLLSVHLL